MDTKRNQTLEEIEENKIVSEHYQNRIKLIKELLKTAAHAVDAGLFEHLVRQILKTGQEHEEAVSHAHSDGYEHYYRHDIPRIGVP